MRLVSTLTNLDLRCRIQQEVCRFRDAMSMKESVTVVPEVTKQFEKQEQEAM